MLDRTYLDQVLALGLGDKRLQLGGGEGVDEAGLGDDEKEHLGTGENRQFIGLEEKVESISERFDTNESRRGTRTVLGRTYLLHDTGLPLGKGNVATRLVLNELDLDLAALTAGLVIIVVVVLGAHAAALGAAGVSAVTGLLEVIVGRRKLLLTN